MKLSLKRSISWLIAEMLILSGIVSFAKKKALRGDYILSIYFHKPSRKEFEDCVKWLLKNEFIFLSTEDIENIISKNLSFPKGAVLLTVDDGWQSNIYNIVEPTINFSIPVTIFVSTEPVETGVFWWSYLNEAKNKKIINVDINSLKVIPNEARLIIVNALKQKLNLPREALTIDQIREITQYSTITIGSHTLSHPILINCNSSQVFNELNISKKYLHNWTGKKIKFFAYPNGDYGEREKKILMKLDYSLAFSTKPIYLTPDILKKRYELPRFEVRENVSLAENICRMVGVWQQLVNILNLRK